MSLSEGARGSHHLRPRCCRSRSIRKVWTQSVGQSVSQSVSQSEASIQLTFSAWSTACVDL
eukprot:259362-Prorocentrum_minimum.AAC.1